MSLFKFLLAAFLLAQTPTAPSPQCPTIIVSCPDDTGLGKPVAFTARVTGGDPGVTPTFKWTVSAGVISGGQGTSSITVDNSSETSGRTLTAAVEVGGYVRSCQTSVSCTLNICNLQPQPRKLDEYGDIQVGDEKARLGNFAVELQNDPTALAHLICYGGRRGGALAARRRCRRAANYLGSGFLGIDDSRIAIVEGGRRESLAVELWLVPSGARPPTPTPTFFPKGRGRR